MAISEALQRRIAGFMGDKVAPPKGATSDKELAEIRKNRMNMGVAIVHG